MRIDLHAHSSASDGTDSPAELMMAAAAAGLDVVAITDHDTTAGWDSAAGAKPDGLTVVLGAEFSCVHVDAVGRRVALHLLGYLFDPEDKPLRAERRALRASRSVRAEQIVQRLVADGFPVTWTQVTRLANGGSVGRPHVARALVDAGVVASIDAAFGSLLSSSGPYYVRKPDLEVLSAIELILAAGGLPVFAHPLAHRRGPIVTDDAVADMAAAGLVGIEVDHPDHDAKARAHAGGLAAELNLIGTGSSDYHGANKTTSLGACTTSPEAFERLLALPAARRPLGEA